MSLVSHLSYDIVTNTSFFSRYKEIFKFVGTIQDMFSFYLGGCVCSGYVMMIYLMYVHMAALHRLLP